MQAERDDGHVDEAVMTVMTEEEYADWRRSQEYKVVQRGACFWEGKRYGFYEGLHWLTRVPASSVSRPSRLCWGYRITLHEADSGLANATMPVHLLPDISGYDLQGIGSKRRNKIKNCHKQVRILELNTPKLLYEQGYMVRKSAHRRTGYGRLPTPDEYLAQIGRHFNPRRGLILAGLIGDRLGGYVIAYAIRGTVYIQDVQLATETLSTNIGTGLIFELIQACRRSGKINEAVYGLHAPEDRPLCQYKKEMGFPVVYIPARVWFLPLAESLLRKRRPYAYYRLTGCNLRE